MTDYQDIGTFLRRYRELAGLELAQVAELTEIDPLELARYENGELSIPLDHVFVLSNTLNIPPEEVVRVFFEAGLNDAISKRQELRKA